MKNENLKSALSKMNSLNTDSFSEMEILNPEEALSLVGGEGDCGSKCFINICRGNCTSDCTGNTCCPDE